MKRCITINKIVVTLLTIFVSISAYSQKAGGEIARVIPLVKKNYYGRPYKNNVVKKNRVQKIYSGEECFDKGIDEVMLNNDFTKAFDWFIKGALKSDGPCELMCGMEYETGKATSQNYYKAVDYYKKAANKGIPLAQTLLARCYYNGTGVSKDERQALFWWEKAAKTGDSYAQADLGAYYSDLQVPNMFLSAYYYEQSAQQGNPIGQMGLACRYLYGEGKDQNSVLAITWMEKAAQQGYLEAMEYLGGLYGTGGNGVQINYEKAAYWFKTASIEGSEIAKSLLPKIIKMSGLPENELIKKYWAEKCKNITSTQSSENEKVIKVNFNNFIYSFGNALLDENKKATFRYMLESIRKEMSNNFHLIIYGYRDPQEPDFISYERAYRVYEELVKLGVKNFQIKKVDSGDTNSGYDISTESGRQKSRTISIFITL